MKLILFLIIFDFFLSTRTQHDHHEDISGSVETKWESPMEIDYRSMHKYCTGECIFDPVGCEKLSGHYNCSKILSIQKFNPPCQTPTDNATTDLCDRKNNLYMISMISSVGYSIKKRKSSYERTLTGDTVKCNVEPYIGISFTNNSEATVIPTDLKKGQLGDIFYICIADESYVTSWIKPVDPPARPDPSCFILKAPRKINNDPNFQKIMMQQILHTKPYPPMGSSVLWSKIQVRTDQYALGCKFVLSNLDKDLMVDFDKLEQDSKVGSITIPIFQSKYMKIATGFAYIKNGIVEDIIFDVQKSVRTRANPVAMAKNSESSLVVFDGISNWNSSTLDYIKNPVNDKTEEDKKNKRTQEEVHRVYDLCLKKQALCFVRQDEKYCMAKRQCHYLAAIESLDGEQFTKLRLSMIIQQVKIHGVKPQVHTKLWGGFGLSNDTKMGKDLVFLCAAYGEFVWTRATYNTDQQNMYLAEEAFHEPVVNISVKIDGLDPNDPTSNAVYGDSSHDLSMCKINITVPDPVDIKAFYYLPANSDVIDPDKWPILHFNLQEHEYYVLVAQGTGVYPPSGTINYHTYSAVCDGKFSKKIYLETTNRVSTSKPLQFWLWVFVNATFLCLIFIS